MKPDNVDLKGKPVEDLRRIGDSFVIKSDNVVLMVRQPKPRDLKAMQEAMAKIDRKSWIRYAPYSSIWESLEQASHLPPFQRGSQDTLYMIMIIDNEVVGFSSHTYRGIGEGRLVIGGLCLTNPWRGKGIGSLYGKLSEIIAVFNGARSFHGQTRLEGGMYNIRLRDGWETEKTFKHKGNMMATIKKVLPNTLEEAYNLLIGEEERESPPS